MPNYDYVCLDCGDEFEAFQRMTEQPLSVCKKCSGKLKRKIGTGAGFVFKGAPVSETDYRLSSSYKDGEKRESGGDKPAGQETKPDGKGEKKTEGKSESKAAAKSA
jgi:putative FmdB family regulatory protein